MECSYSINEPHLTPNFLASVLQLDLPLVYVFQPGGGRGAVCQYSVCSTAVPHEIENARQHTFPKLCVVPDGPWSTPDSRACVGAVRREHGRPFPFTSNVPVRCNGSKVVE